MAPKLAASSGTCSHEVHPTFSAQSRTHSTRTAHAVPGSERSLVSPTSILHFHIICSSHELNVLYYSIHAVGGRIITTSTHTHTVPSTSSTSTLPHTYPAAGWPFRLRATCECDDNVARMRSQKQANPTAVSVSLSPAPSPSVSVSLGLCLPLPVCLLPAQPLSISVRHANRLFIGIWLWEPIFYAPLLALSAAKYEREMHIKDI